MKNPHTFLSAKEEIVLAALALGGVMCKIATSSRGVRTVVYTLNEEDVTRWVERLQHKQAIRLKVDTSTGKVETIG